MSVKLAALISVVLLMILVTTGFSQAPGDAPSNPLDTVKRLNQVAAQKLEADVRLAVRTATRLATTSPEKALEKLKETLTAVEDSAALSDDRKATLRSMLKDRIRVSQIAVKDSNGTDDVGSKVRKAGRKAEDQKTDADRDELKRLLEGIKKLQREGKLGQARLLSGDLAGRFADKPVARAAERIASTTEQVAANRQLEAERQRAGSGVLREVDRSALPPTGDIQFPKDWKERTKNRKDPSKPRLTAKEEAIFRGLNTPISPTFKDSHLEDVIEYLRTFIGQPIILDPRAMDEAGVHYDTPVTLKMKNVAVRTVLKKIVRDLGLTYVIKDEVVEITTHEKARNMMAVRVYSVADLVQDATEAGTFIKAAMLIDLIQSTLDPESWKANGGAGTIVYNPITRSIVIKQTSEFHASMGSVLP